MASLSHGGGSQGCDSIPERKSYSAEVLYLSLRSSSPLLQTLLWEAFVFFSARSACFFVLLFHQKLSKKYSAWLDLKLYFPPPSSSSSTLGNAKRILARCSPPFIFSPDPDQSQGKDGKTQTWFLLAFLLYQHDPQLIWTSFKVRPEARLVSLSALRASLLTQDAENSSHRHTRRSLCPHQVRCSLFWQDMFSTSSPTGERCWRACSSSRLPGLVAQNKWKSVIKRKIKVSTRGAGCRFFLIEV